MFPRIIEPQGVNGMCPNFQIANNCLRGQILLLVELSAYPLQWPGSQWCFLWHFCLTWSVILYHLFIFKERVIKMCQPYFGYRRVKYYPILVPRKWVHYMSLVLDLIHQYLRQHSPGVLRLYFLGSNFSWALPFTNFVVC